MENRSVPSVSSCQLHLHQYLYTVHNLSSKGAKKNMKRGFLILRVNLIQRFNIFSSNRKNIKLQMLKCYHSFM